jgi:hypothetical protein
VLLLQGSVRLLPLPQLPAPVQRRAALAAIGCWLLQHPPVASRCCCCCWLQPSLAAPEQAGARCFAGRLPLALPPTLGLTERQVLPLPLLLSSCCAQPTAC